MTTWTDSGKTTAPPGPRRGPRRGPLRPRRLVSVRANQSRRLSSYVFRAVDLIAIGIVTTVMIARESPLPLLSTPVRLILPLVVGALVCGRLLRSLGFYRFVSSDGTAAHVARTASALGASVVAVFATRWTIGAGPSAAACWEWIVTTAVVLAVLHTVWWAIVATWRAAGWLTPNLVIVGATEYAENVIRDAVARRHVNVLAVFDDRLARNPSAVLGVPVLGNVEALLSHRITPYIDRIVIAIEPTATKRVNEVATRLSVLPNEVTLFLSQDDSAGRSSALARLEDRPLADINGTTDVGRRALAKRLQDLLVGVPLLILTSPILALVAVLIKIDSPGPVFFRQRRHGFNNEEIVVWKFRSMRTDVTGAARDRQVAADDDRVTRIGRILRKSSLDELPQLLNVVRGEMSLVGPRPHAIGMKTGDVESARLIAEYAHRHRIKPGMTGWAAVNGSRGPLHSPAEVQRRVALDVEYIARQSFALDVWIMTRTVPRIFGDRDVVR